MIALLLVGCGLSNRDVGVFVDAQTRLVNDVQSLAYKVETKTAFEPWRHGQGDGPYAYSGTIDPTPAQPEWTGTVACVGTGEVSGGGNKLTYDLNLTLTDVGIRGLTMNGTEEATIEIDIDNESVAVSTGVTGELDVAGAFVGHASCDYTTLASSTVALTYAGTVNDVDVAQFSQ